MSTVDLTVVVPAYNEERRLGPTLETISAYLSAPDSHWTDWELIVVDDGSTDRTREIADAVAARDHRIRVLRLGRNRGKGHALRAGVLASYGRRVLVTDADLAAPITELERLSKALTDGHSAAIGSRATDGATIERHQHRIRELLGRGGNFLIRGVAVPGIRDTQCGFKLFDGERARTAFAASRLTGWGIDVEILQYFRRRSWPVAEVPVRWAHQPGSKVRPLDYARVLAELSRLTARKPFHRPAAALRALRGADLAVAALFLLASTLLYAGRWADPGGRYLVDSMQDQNQWEWFFAVTADNVARLDNPLYTTLQGYPDGVNLMANTAMLGLSIPFAPVTWMFGPAVTLNLVMTLGLAATAVCWYWLLVRRFTGHRGAAATGAALATFAPPMISHANAHPNFVVLFMMPLIVDRALRLCEGRRVVRDGIVLGLMATYQIFLGEEPLLLAAMGMLLFAAGYGLARRDVARAVWRPLGRGLLIALAVCLPLVAFPLSWQFFGPQSYTHVVHGDNTGNSPLALLSFAERSLAGDAANAAALSANPTEQNAFYGWPLLTLTTAIVIVLWRRTAVKALAFTAFAAAALSLGIRVPVPFTDLALPGPWKLLASAPLFESVIESRVAMICAPVLGILLALALDAARTAEAPCATPSRPPPSRPSCPSSPCRSRPWTAPPCPPSSRTATGASTSTPRTARASSPYRCPTRPSPNRCTGRPPPTSASGCPAATSTAPTAPTGSASTARRPAGPPTCCATCATAARSRRSATPGGNRPAATSTSGGPERSSSSRSPARGRCARPSNSSSAIPGSGATGCGCGTSRRGTETVPPTGQPKQPPRITLPVTDVFAVCGALLPPDRTRRAHPWPVTSGWSPSSTCSATAPTTPSPRNSRSTTAPWARRGCPRSRCTRTCRGCPGTSRPSPGSTTTPCTSCGARTCSS